MIQKTYFIQSKANPGIDKIGRVRKQRLFICDLLFIERFMFSGDHNVATL